MPAKVEIEQGEEEVPVVVLAEAIVKLSDAAYELLAGPLKRKAIVLLIQNMTGLPQRTINAVLDALPDLANEYVR